MVTALSHLSHQTSLPCNVLPPSSALIQQPQHGFLISFLILQQVPKVVQPLGELLHKAKQQLRRGAVGLHGTAGFPAHLQLEKGIRGSGTRLPALGEMDVTLRRHRISLGWTLKPAWSHTGLSRFCLVQIQNFINLAFPKLNFSILVVISEGRFK